MTYKDSVMYFISYAKLPTNIPAAKLHTVLGLGVFIDMDNDEIVDVSCTLLTEEARCFIKQLIVGNFFNKDGLEIIIKNINSRYHGYAKKAIIIAIKESYQKYNILKKEL